MNTKGEFNTNSDAAKKWMSHQLRVCDDLHFNTLGQHTHNGINPELYKKDIFYVASIDAYPVASWQVMNGRGELPDVFSNEFEKRINEKVFAVVNKNKNESNLLGYAYSDTPHWMLEKHHQDKLNERIMIYPWVNAIMKLDRTTAGKKKWIAHLKSRYNNPNDVAKVWGLTIGRNKSRSWDVLFTQKDWFRPVQVKKAQEDMATFTEVIADKWYQLHYNAIKKLDNHHLIIGDKNSLGALNEFLIAPLKKYVDVISVQSYNTWDTDKQKFEWIYSKIGKPIYNGDGSFAYINSNQVNNKVKGHWTGAKNLTDVKTMYVDYLNNIMTKPYFIGWHHCGMLQQWGSNQRGDVSMNENGFMNPFEAYYTEWTDAIRTINKEAFTIHKKAK